MDINPNSEVLTNNLCHTAVWGIYPHLRTTPHCLKSVLMTQHQYLSIYLSNMKKTSILGLHDRSIFFKKFFYRPQAKSMGESQKSLWAISGSPSYGFNPVSEGVPAVATRNRHVFFKLKKLRVFFF